MIERRSRTLFPVSLCMMLAALALGGCGGGDGDDGNSPPPATSVTISGKITFERLAFNTVTGTGLNTTAPVESPARQVTVEALDAASADAILATTTTDDGGAYSVTVPANRNVKIRAKAEMIRTGATPSWDFSVRNNTNGNALYAVDGDPASSGTSNSTRNVRAPSGWGSTSYTGARVAAPFAILDTIYSAKQVILSAAASTAFPALSLYWSTQNRPVDNLCTTDGNIGTTFYTQEVTALNSGNCTPPTVLGAGIYILGDYANGNGDTDEFDQHVIAHEFGHYIEDKFSRSDSIGGSHSGSDRLDLRVAFGEGWGNAYSGMALNDPVYRDSFGGVAGDTGFSLEADNQNGEGWFSEFSVGEILWDLFDDAKEDPIAGGFAPIYSIMTGAQKDTEALTSIFSFSSALRAANASQAANIDAVLTGELISGTDAFGSDETNSGGVSTALPIYTDITVGQAPIAVCSIGTSDRNKLGYRRFLRLNLATTSVLTITATGAVSNQTGVAATDPDIYVYRNGTIVAFDDAVSPTAMISQNAFSAGLHIIEVYDYDLGVLPRCMAVSVQGVP
jgi:hypothetical protein